MFAPWLLFIFLPNFAFLGVNNFLAFPLLQFPYTYLIHSKTVTSCLNPFEYIQIQLLLRYSMFYSWGDLVFEVFWVASFWAGFVSWPGQHQGFLCLNLGTSLASLYGICFLESCIFLFSCFVPHFGGSSPSLYKEIFWPWWKIWKQDDELKGCLSS